MVILLGSVRFKRNRPQPAMPKLSVSPRRAQKLRQRLSHSLIALFALWLGLSVVNAAPVTQLKVLSFNIWVQGGLSLSNCIEVIRTSEADIVGLQECNQSTAQIIATNLGFYVLPA